MGRRWAACLLLALALVGCAAKETERAEEIAQKYAALEGYSAEVKIDVPREEETLRYALALRGDGEETRVCVREPEELADVTAILRADTLSLSYDGLVLDAGSLAPRVMAVNAVPLLLRAVAEGYVCEESAERLGDTPALRVRIEAPLEGETLQYTVFFSDQDVPLYAEIAQEDKIILFMEFTNFTFDDIIS